MIVTGAIRGGGAGSVIEAPIQDRAGTNGFGAITLGGGGREGGLRELSADSAGRSGGVTVVEIDEVTAGDNVGQQNPIISGGGLAGAGLIILEQVAIGIGEAGVGTSGLEFVERGSIGSQLDINFLIGDGSSRVAKGDANPVGPTIVEPFGGDFGSEFGESETGDDENEE